MKITQGNLFVALREMSLHGKKEFDQFSSAISLSMQDAKLDFNSYNFVLEWVLAYTGVSNSDISYYFYLTQDLQVCKLVGMLVEHISKISLWPKANCTCDLVLEFCLHSFILLCIAFSAYLGITERGHSPQTN